MAVSAKKIVLPIIVIAIAVVGANVLMGGKKPPATKAHDQKDLLVEVISAQAGQHVYQIHSQGMVQPKIKSQLVAEVTGKIIKISDSFVNGGFFNKGDVLVELDPSDHLTNVKAADAALARAQATLAEEKARSEVAEKEWESFMKGEAPDLYLRKPQLARELANVKAAQADLERAKRELNRTKVVAPFNGIVKAKQADLGQFVTKGAVLGQVYGTDIAEIRLPITDSDFQYLSFQTSFDLATQKPEVVFATDSSAGENDWRGTLVRTEGIVDEANRMIYLVAAIDDPYGLASNKQAIEFGRFVHANIAGRESNNIVVIPRDILVDEKQIIKVVDDKLAISNVSVDRFDNQFAYVSRGIETGDALVITHLKNPIEGTPVKRVESTSQRAGEAQ
jgi:RND family efflux transporter MFP subunit